LAPEIVYLPHHFPVTTHGKATCIIEVATFDEKLSFLSGFFALVQ